MTPSFFMESLGRMCEFGEECGHEVNCGVSRLRNAVFVYLRTGGKASYRDLEMVWGVSRSTIQRESVRLQGKSDLYFLVDGMGDEEGGRRGEKSGKGVGRGRGKGKKGVRKYVDRRS